MKIGFDAKRAFLNSTGLGTYSRSLLNALANHQPALALHAYTPSAAHTRLFNPQPPIVVHRPVSFLSSLFPSAWRASYLVNDLRRDQIEVYHGLSHELPAGIEKTSIKTVVSIHDVIFRHHPEWYPRFDRTIYNLKWKHALKVAHAVICISHQTRQDVLHFYGNQIPCLPQKITVIPPIVEPRFTPRPLSGPPAGKPYLLAVGRLEARKNLGVMLEALALLEPGKRPELVIAGKSTDYQKELERLTAEKQLEGSVRFTGEVSAGALSDLLAGSLALVYPSRMEGFGYPIVEAQQAGVPVICSDIPLFREVAGAGALFANPLDPDAWKLALQNILQMNENQYQTYQEAGFRNTSRFSPKQGAIDCFRVYESLLGKEPATTV